MFVVIAKTTTYQTVIDSIWEQQKAAQKRADEFWNGADIHVVYIQEYEINTPGQDIEYDGAFSLESYDNYSFGDDDYE